MTGRRCCLGGGCPAKRLGLQRKDSSGDSQPTINILIHFPKILLPVQLHLKTNSFCTHTGLCYLIFSNRNEYSCVTSQHIYILVSALYTWVEIEILRVNAKSIFLQAGQMLRGSGGRKEASASECSGRQPEGVPA